MKSSTSKHPVVCYGEILWDLLPSGPQPGGAPMNVAYHLQKLGRNPAMISRIGTDERGRELLEILKEKNVCTDYVQTDPEVPTGIVNAQQKANGDMVYDIVSPAAWDHIAPEAAALALPEQAEYFVFGSLACRHADSRNTLFQLLQKANTKVLDINLRAPHFSNDLITSLLQQTDILKINHGELELVASWYGHYSNDEDRIHLLRDKFQLRTVLLTKGTDGAVLHTDGKSYSHPGYKVNVVDTVGSGDAFLAATLSMFIQQASPEEILDKANRLAATIATYKGACPDYDITEII